MRARQRETRHAERGAALVTVLLFMTLTFILITSMLAVTGNEVVISGIQRDGTRALEYAQAGVQEAVRRMEEGRRYSPSFTGSLSLPPGATLAVSVFRRFTGVNSAYQEIQARATLGRATRRISFLVLQQIISFPPNITFAASVIEQGSAQIICGDAYARTFIQYAQYPVQGAGCTEPPTVTYAGWRMSKTAPDAVNYCYDHDSCVSANNPTPPNPPYENEQVTRWWPSHRRTENETTVDGVDIKAQTKKCPAGGGGTLPTDTIAGVPASAPTDCLTDAACALTPYWNPSISVYGFDTDVVSGTPQAVNDALPCGLPYKMVRVTFPAEDGMNRTRIFKTILFEQWFGNYWRFDDGLMKVLKRNGSACTYGDPEDPYCPASGVEANLKDNAILGAVPPFPEMDSVENNFDCMKSGGGVINALPISCAEPPATTSDFGCYPSGSWTCGAEREVQIVLEGPGDWTLNGTMKGHGTIVVDGNLTVNGDFEYWGTVIVKGVLTLGAGSAKIHGGLVADSTLKISGNIQVDGGGTISNVPTGRSIILGRGWWER